MGLPEIDEEQSPTIPRLHSVTKTHGHGEGCHDEGVHIRQLLITAVTLNINA